MQFEHADGRRVPKFVNLDMEEYRDLAITTAAFTRALDREEFKQHAAGIVLQAYLPDSFAIQQTLTDWARKPRRRRRSPHQDQDRQGRQPGNGAGGIGPFQLAPGHL